MDSSIRTYGGHASTGSVVPRSTSAPATTGVVDLPALQAASRVLQEQHAKDVSIVPDLGDMLTIPGRPSSSSYSIFPDDYRVPFQKKRLSGIPEDVFKFYSAARHTTYMGLLPSLERVWISIDHQLILWDYVEGQELNTFAEQSDTITQVALVKPKPGVFIDDIQHLLVICTPVSVLLLGIQEVPGVGANGRPRKELKVYETGMSVPTEVQMSSVIGMADGRIFMCGTQDGHLYELHYQEKEGWFGKRIQIINHSIGGVQSLLPMFSSSSSQDRIVSLTPDLERDCFYTLTENSVVSVYKPAGERTVQLVQTINNIYKSAQDKAPGSPALTPSSFRIITLQVVQPAESRVGVQLVAVTSNGVRLYFSASTAGYGYAYGTASATTAPRQLQLIHVRLPPADLLHPDEQAKSYRSMNPSASAGQPATSRPFSLAGLETSIYETGVTLAAQPGDTDAQDYLLCMSLDLTRVGTLGQTQPQAIEPPLYQGAVTGVQRSPLVEYATLVPVQGRTWDIAAVPRSSSVSYPGVNELSAQFSEPSRSFMVLTSAGLSFLAKRRPLDYLRDVLDEVHADQNYQPIVHFRDSFGRDQTCAMLLGIASGNTFLELGESVAAGTLTRVSPELANLAKQAFYDFGDRPTYVERVTYGTSEASGSTTFSGRREGLAIYFARLVRPIWKSKITQTRSLGLQALTVSEDTLTTIQKNLFALKDFLDQNPQLFHSAPGDHTGSRPAATPEQDAWRVEQKSVSQLQALLARTTEAISFVLLLNDYKIGELIAQADADVQKIISGLTYEDLVTASSGVTVSRALVNIVIDQQIGQQIGVDTVSEVLQSRCGSFCSTDDVMLYKAKENVRKAAEARHPTHRQELLAESLRLFVKGARILDFDKLREIVGDYQHLQYARGAVELPLHSAQIEDPDNQGLMWQHAGAAAGDSRSILWDKRRQCYDLVLDSLAIFDQQGAKADPAADAQATRSLAFELALSAEDEGFHSALYDWLISRGLADQLLEMRPPYLEAHLRREPASVDKYQLLWQFYVKAGAPLRAAEVLGTMAESDQFDLDLNARLECLTLAVGNAKSHPVSAGGRHETALAYLTDLEEKLEVAQVQLDIYHTLLPRAQEGGAVADRIHLLQTTLMNISDLYSEYAEPFDLPQIKLLVLHVSEHRDEALSRSIWNGIFEEAIGDEDGIGAADRIAAKVIPLGQRFFPSDSAFPLRHVASTLVRFALAHKQSVPPGWAPRVLIQCGIPQVEVWDLLHEMYESQVPPFNEQANVQALSADLAVFLTDWAEEAARPSSTVAREFPVSRVDRAIDQYLEELEPSRTEVRAMYEAIKRQLRRYW